MDDLEATESKGGLKLNYYSEGPNNSAKVSTFSTINGEASMTQLPDLAKDWQSLLLTYCELIKK